jgi:fibronectin type 3 domain-containing protein
MVAMLPGKYSTSKAAFCMAKFYGGTVVSPTNTLSQFRKPGLSCLPALFFISLVTLILLISSTNVYSAQATLTWDPNSESDLAGYKVYYGNSSENYDTNIDVGNQTSYTISGLVDGNAYYFAATAYDTSSNESGYSEEVVYTAPIIDTTPPTITSVSTTGSSTQIILVFSEPLEESSATNVLNYSIDNAITVFTASLGSDLKTVTLTTSELTDGVTYILTVNNIMDLASTPNVIAPNTTASDIFVNQLVISNLTVESGLAYEIVEKGLQNGAMVYIDRESIYSSVLTLMKGASYIKTANKDKGESKSSFLTFDVNQDVTVYVAHDDQINKKPSWLTSFTDTGNDLVTTDTALSIFANNFLAGTITLGGNEGKGNRSMYTVIIVKYDDSGGCTDNDGDGWCIEDGDCDDNNPNTYLGATEFCDGIDNNCDGVIDEGCSGGCTDNDGDGWCIEDGDCDDNDRHVNPGHNDSGGRWGKDGVDNDCNGIIDG